MLYDVAMDGCYTMSMTICPVWFLICIIKNTIWCPGRRIAVVRISMPLVMLAIAVSNGNLQWRISDANAQKVIEACDEFRVVNGRYPKTLDELVPKNLASVPPAKHCLMGSFMFFNNQGKPMLVWSRYGFYRRIYDFETKQWSNLD